MKVVIVNDTAVRPHFGCELVMQTYREQLKRVDIELIKTIPKGRAIQIPDSTDMVLVNGEGGPRLSRPYGRVLAIYLPVAAAVS